MGYIAVVLACLTVAVCAAIYLLLRRPKSPEALTAEMVSDLHKAMGATIPRVDALTRALSDVQERASSHEHMFGDIMVGLKAIKGYAEKSWQFVTEHADAWERQGREQTTALRALTEATLKRADTFEDNLLDIDERLVIVEKYLANGGGEKHVGEFG